MGYIVSFPDLDPRSGNETSEFKAMCCDNWMSLQSWEIWQPIEVHNVHGTFPTGSEIASY